MSAQILSLDPPAGNMAIPLPSRTLPLQYVGTIKAVVADSYGISRDHMSSPARHRSVAWPRQVAMYLARELTHHSCANIGRMFGARDHTTVLYAIRAVNKRMVGNELMRADVEALREALS